MIEKHRKGQPVLLGTVAVETSEYISNLLKNAVFVIVFLMRKIMKEKQKLFPVQVKEAL